MAANHGHQKAARYRTIGPRGKRFMQGRAHIIIAFLQQAQDRRHGVPVRIVVRSVLLLALMVGLSSLVLAQSRDYSDRPGTSSQQYGDGVVSTGTCSGRDVKWPDG
jgi:hypothetical protein